jgi:3-oxoadipate enol-lactonase
VTAGPYTIKELSLDVLALADHLGVSRFHYAGISLGGMVGMWLAAHEPDRVRRLVLLCTSAFLDAEDYWRQRAATVRTAGLESIVDPIVSRWFTPGYRAAHPDVFAGYRAGMVGTPAEGYAGCCEAIGAMDLRADLPAITAPTLVASGARDQSIPPEHGERIAEAVPGARFEVLDDAAHLAIVQQSGAVTALLREHLAG